MANIKMINLELKEKDIYDYFDKKPENIEKINRLVKQEHQVEVIDTLSFYNVILGITEGKFTRTQIFFHLLGFLIAFLFTFWLVIPAIIRTNKFKMALNQFLNEREQFVRNIFDKSDKTIYEINEYLTRNNMWIYQYDNFTFKTNEIFDKYNFFASKNILFKEFINSDIPYPLVDKIQNIKLLIANNNKEKYNKWRLYEDLLKWYEYKSDFLVYSEIKRARLISWINSFKVETSRYSGSNVLYELISFLYKNLEANYLDKINVIQDNSFLPYSTKYDPNDFLIEIDKYFSFIFNQVELLIYFNTIANIYDVIVNGNSNLLLNNNKSSNNIQNFSNEEEFYTNAIFNIILSLGASALEDALIKDEIYLNKLPFDVLINNNIWPFDKYNFLGWEDSSITEFPLLIHDTNLNYPEFFKINKKISFDQIKKYIKNLNNNLKTDESEILLNNLVNLKNKMEYLVDDEIKNSVNNIINSLSEDLSLQFKNILGEFYAISEAELNEIFFNILKNDYDSLLYAFLLIRNLNNDLISNNEIVNEYKSYYNSYFSSLINVINYKVQSNIKIKNYLIPDDIKNCRNFENFSSLISHIKKSCTNDELYFLNKLIDELEVCAKLSIDSFEKRLNYLRELYDWNVNDLSNNLKQILMNISNSKKHKTYSNIDGQIFIKNNDFSNKNSFVVELDKFTTYIKNNISPYLFLFSLQFKTNSSSTSIILNSMKKVNDEYYKDYKLLGSYVYNVGNINLSYEIETNSQEKVLKFVNTQEERKVPLDLGILNKFLKSNSKQIINTDSLMNWLVNRSGFDDFTIDSMIKELRDKSNLEYKKLIKILTNILFVNME